MRKYINRSRFWVQRFWVLFGKFNRMNFKPVNAYVNKKGF